MNSFDFKMDKLGLFILMILPPAIVAASILLVFCCCFNAERYRVNIAEEDIRMSEFGGSRDRENSEISQHRPYNADHGME